jgi:hypothetical protein
MTRITRDRLLSALRSARACMEDIRFLKEDHKTFIMPLRHSDVVREVNDLSVAFARAIKLEAIITKMLTYEPAENVEDVTKMNNTEANEHICDENCPCTCCEAGWCKDVPPHPLEGDGHRLIRIRYQGPNLLPIKMVKNSKREEI